jgi:predicted DNA-binding transcriptional regulator AlpA
MSEVPRALVLTIADLSELLRTSERTLHRLNSGGRIPQPFRLGGQLRWRQEEIVAWVAAGMPDRRAWARQWSATGVRER